MEIKIKFEITSKRETIPLDERGPGVNVGRWRND